MINVLLITVIGMGLVFVVILMLWAMMELLVRLLAEKPQKTQTETTPAPVEAEMTESPAAGTRKQKAAAVAVAAALLIRRRQAAVEAVRLALASRGQGMLAPEAGQTSNWQAVMRAVQRQNQMKFFTRTPKNVR